MSLISLFNQTFTVKRKTFTENEWGEKIYSTESSKTITGRIVPRESIRTNIGFTPEFNQTREGIVEDYQYVLYTQSDLDQNDIVEYDDKEYIVVSIMKDSLNLCNRILLRTYAK